MTRRYTAATINAALKAQGQPYKVVQGRGYVYIVGGDSHEWYTSSIAVCYVRDLGDDIGLALNRVQRHIDEQRSR